MWKYLTIVGLASFKFMFSPLAGEKLGLTFLESFFSTLVGALISWGVFYFMSEYFMRRNHAKKVEKYKKALATNDPNYKRPKNFTRLNKTIVKVKTTLGIYITCWLVPLFLSIPIGSIICAKFYGHHKKTPYLILAGIVLNTFLLCCIWYFVGGMVDVKAN
ncbi:hypothetical protein SAMN05216474_1302 [Lishizhenia tianjinensis]|uniref:Small multi-drug export protein n=1 Tax=Lishizhenia tianjinensis TaxID=477690 RepID=A0A1I6YYY9_9FLAO|nr:hypothetical protein [Lishizhenia tianjinensis]SFT55652.1 hypothetical protein SAMN05216474_1302 [Lishizhenia tianjinensis]